VMFSRHLSTKIKRKKQTDARRLLWRIVHWWRDVDRLRVDIRLLISRTITPIPIPIMFATPFLMAVIVAPVTPPMAVVMISEC
jgi:hypothetical protein